MRRATYSACRHPKTTQEKRYARVAEDWPEYAITYRKGRNSANLPSERDDIFHHYQKSWKSKRKTQYRLAGSRSDSRKRVMLVDVTPSWPSMIWKYEDYLRERDIPHRIEKVKESYCYWSWHRMRWVQASYTKYYKLTWWK